MLFQPNRQLIRQLAIPQQYDLLLRYFTLHCSASYQPQKLVLQPHAADQSSHPSGSVTPSTIQLTTVLYAAAPARFARSFRVARNSVFFAVSSVVLNISPIVRSFSPW